MVAASEGGGTAVPPLRVLIVYASTTDAKRVVKELQRAGRSIDLEHVVCAGDMRAALQRRPWDVFISDWTPPTFSGRAALNLLKELRLDPPFLAVSGTLGAEHTVAAMRAGANDYLLKDELGRLAPIIERELRERESRRTQKQAKLARDEAGRRMRRMVEAAMVGIWFHAAKSKASFMNLRMAQILGLSAEEAAHASAEDFVDLEDRPRLDERLAARAVGIPGSYEQKFRRRDGCAGWGLVESTPLYDEKGAFEGVLNVDDEITKRRTSEAAQREAELRFQRIFDSRMTGILIANLS